MDNNRLRQKRKNTYKKVDKWLTQEFGQYASRPAKTRDQALEEIWNSDVPLEVKIKLYPLLIDIIAA